MAYCISNYTYENSIPFSIFKKHELAYKLIILKLYMLYQAYTIFTF